MRLVSFKNNGDDEGNVMQNKMRDAAVIVRENAEFSINKSDLKKDDFDQKPCQVFFCFISLIFVAKELLQGQLFSAEVFSDPCFFMPN